jgi:hypothetical protein
MNYKSKHLKNLKKRVKPKARVPTRRVFRTPPGNYADAGGTMVNVPTAMGGKSGSRKMFPLSRGIGGNMRVCNYEQLLALTGSNGTFSAGGAVINPGLANAFPWLSTIASNYQSFRFHYLRFVYVPACPTTTAGTAFLYLDYNIDSGAPSTLQQVDIGADSCSGPPWLGSPVDASVAFGNDLQVSRAINVNVDVTKFTQPWYNVRTTNNANLNTGGALGGTIPALLTFTQGNIYDTSGRPCTLYYGSNTNTSSVIGIIYSCYDVEFFNPVAAALNT